MPELTGEDVTNYTGGRLDGENEEVQRMLAASLMLARRYCGWHVNPVIEDDTVLVDGPDSRILMLPTRKLVELTSVEEDGAAVALDKLRWSVGQPPGLFDAPVRVRKNGGGWWTSNYQGVEVVMTHGYSDAEAVDWRQAVLSCVDQLALVTANVDAGALTRKQIDDVAYSYQPYITMGAETIYSMNYIFDSYKLPAIEFM
jgi:hypothetical protein